MKIIKYLFILILFFSIAHSADEMEALTCAGVTTNTWTDVIGSGCALHEDANDATYILGDGAGQLAHYSIDDCAYAYDLIDSLVLKYRFATKSSSKNDYGHVSVITVDSIYNTAWDWEPTSATDSVRQMTTKPGGGAWTVSDINSVSVKFVQTAHAGGGGLYVFEFSLEVWGTREVGGADQLHAEERLI